MNYHGIEEEYTHTAFCPVDNCDVSIDITYYSVPNNDFSSMRTFNKHENKCEYLIDGKCNKRTSCPVYKDAPQSYQKEINGKY